MTHDSFGGMASLTRCPSCDTFVKPTSISEGTCLFCANAEVASRRSSIPGVVLAAAMAAAPGCSDDAKPTPDASVVPDAAPVYGIAADATPTNDAMPAVDADLSIYGIAPESE